MILTQNLMHYLMLKNKNIAKYRNFEKFDCDKFFPKKERYFLKSLSLRSLNITYHNKIFQKNTFMRLKKCQYFCAQNYLINR